jgi:hypothetical protein
MQLRWMAACSVGAGASLRAQQARWRGQHVIEAASTRWRAPGGAPTRGPSAQIFFLAGMETTAHAATWVLFQLSQHPAAEAAVERELDAAGLLVTADRPHPRALEHADLAGLAYLQAVIKARQRARRPARPACVRLQRAVDEPWSAPWLLAHGRAAPPGPARCRAVSLWPACLQECHSTA